MLHGKIGSPSTTSRDTKHALEPTTGKHTLVEQAQRHEPVVQRKAAGDAAPQGGASPAELAQRGMASGGGPLPHREAIQKSFGRHDVSGVSAHQGPATSAAADALGAQAYAHDGAVAFGSSPDLHTAAHEAAHVVQQRAGVQLKGGVGQAGDPYEQHADAVADLVVAGKSAEPLLDQMAGGQGAGGQTADAAQPAGHGAASASRSNAVQRQDRPARDGGGGAAPARIVPPTPGINSAGFIDRDDGANIRTAPIDEGGQLVREQPLPPAARVFVSGRHPQKQDWLYVTYIADAMVRGYVQEFRVNTQLPEPLAELHQVTSGETAETLAQRMFGHAVQPGRDLRFYENVLLYVNQQQSRPGIRGTYQDPNVLGGGANNIQLVANQRIWLVSAAFAQTLAAAVPDGSLTNGAVAGARQIARHLQDILAAVNQSPSHIGDVAGEYARTIQEHRVEIAGVVAAFLTAELASAFLTAAPTGVTQIAAAVIQLLLAFFGAAGMVMATVEAASHAASWLNLGWTANGNPGQIAESSREFVRMLVAIAIAALSYIGMRGNMNNAVNIMNNLPPSGLAPATAMVGGGTGRVGAAAVPTEGILINPSTGGAGVGGNAVMMNDNSREQGSNEQTPSQQPQGEQPATGTGEEPWTPPRSWNGPRNHGTWNGVRGNSGWIDDRPSVIRIVGTGADGKANPVQFRNGVVDFSPWRQGEPLRVPGLTGEHAADMTNIRIAVADRFNLAPGASRSARATAARAYLSSAPDGFGGVGLAPHHAGGDLIELIPRDLHAVQHTDLFVYPSGG